MLLLPLYICYYSFTWNSDFCFKIHRLLYNRRLWRQIFFQVRFYLFFYGTKFLRNDKKVIKNLIIWELLKCIVPLTFNSWHALTRLHDVWCTFLGSYYFMYPRKVCLLDHWEKAKRNENSPKLPRVLCILRWSCLHLPNALLSFCSYERAVRAPAKCSLALLSERSALSPLQSCYSSYFPLFFFCINFPFLLDHSHKHTQIAVGF